MQKPHADAMMPTGITTAKTYLGAAKMAEASQRRNRLTPWYIGMAIVFASVLFVGWRMWAGNCPAPTFVEVGVLVVIPVVYLALMYLTFVSQD